VGLAGGGVDILGGSTGGASPKECARGRLARGILEAILVNASVVSGVFLGLRVRFDGRSGLVTAGTGECPCGVGVEDPASPTEKGVDLARGL
jgi:hypothetical protein